jgi:hypothetical protein
MANIRDDLKRWYTETDDPEHDLEVLCVSCARQRRTQGIRCDHAETPPEWEELTCADCGAINQQGAIWKQDMQEHTEQYHTSLFIVLPLEDKFWITVQRPDGSCLTPGIQVSSAKELAQEFLNLRAHERVDQGNELRLHTDTQDERVREALHVLQEYLKE